MESRPDHAERPQPASQRHGVDVVVMLLLMLIAAWLCLAGNVDSEFWWNDAPRHAMNGVFLLDFVRDLPSSLSLVDYVSEYYARYPCLALVHYPPFFPAVEAVFFAVFGVSVGVARATVAAFGAMGAAFGYLVARRFLGRWAGALFVMLLLTSPLALYWSREVMLETPMTAMMLLSCHFFLGYVEDERRGYGIAAAVCLAFTVMTKQHACVLVPVLILYGLWRRGWAFAHRRESLVAIVVGVLLLVPFVVLTLLYSRVQMGLAVGGFSIGVVESRWSLASMAYYLRRLPLQAGVAGLVALGLLLAGAAVRRLSGHTALATPEQRRGVVLALIWTVVSYLVITFGMIHKQNRYILVCGPAIALLGAAGLALLTYRQRWARVGAGACTAVLVAQLAASAAGRAHDPLARAAPHVNGIEDAARTIAGLPAGTVVFYAGRFNGNFVFHVRRFSPEKRLVVLRASKQLFTVAGHEAIAKEIHADTQDEILDVLRDYGVRYVLVESRTPVYNRLGPVLDELRALVETKRFAERGRHPIRSAGLGLERDLGVYEFLEAGPARASVLEIRLLTAGRTLRVPLRRLGVRTAPQRDKPKEL